MWPNPQETEDLVTFTEGIINGKLHFCTVLNTPELYERLKIYVSDFSEYILWIEEYISSIVTWK